jgi:VanZ family protein
MRADDGGGLARALRAVGRFLLWVPWPLGAVLAGSWLLLIWDLSSHRAPIPAHANFWWEWLSNFAHAPLFGILTILIAALLLREGQDRWPRPRRERTAPVIGCVMLYGLIDEWHQSYVPGRDASLLDVMTDVVSASVVLWIVYTLGREDLRARTLLARLGTGVLICATSAAIATLS